MEKERIVITLEEEKPTPSSLAMEWILDNCGLLCVPGEPIKDDRKKVVKIPIIVKNVGKVGEIIFCSDEPHKILSTPTLYSIIQQIKKVKE